MLKRKLKWESKGLLLDPCSDRLNKRLICFLIYMQMQAEESNQYEDN